VAHCKEATEAKAGSLTLLDEFGLVEVDLPPGGEAPAEAELVLVEGTVERAFGAPALKAARAGKLLPGGAEPVAGLAGTQERRGVA
jgi:hypothetical protein